MYTNSSQCEATILRGWRAQQQEHTAASHTPPAEMNEHRVFSSLSPFYSVQSNISGENRATHTFNLI